jgi:HSP20 family protein
MSENPGQRLLDPLRDLKREVVRLIDTFEPLQNLRFSRPFPAIDVQDAGDRYIVTAELPGQVLNEFELAIKGDELILRGERKPPEGVPDEAYQRRERPHGPWTRSVRLPYRVESDQAHAHLDQGILTISLPKADEMKPKRIVVSSAQDQ